MKGHVVYRAWSDLQEMKKIAGCENIIAPDYLQNKYVYFQHTLLCYVFIYIFWKGNRK